MNIVHSRGLPEMAGAISADIMKLKAGEQVLGDGRFRLNFEQGPAEMNGERNIEQGRWKYPWGSFVEQVPNEAEPNGGVWLP